MNIVTRLADIERLLAEVVSTIDDRTDGDRSTSAVSDGPRLIDDLDQAQMLKAAAYGTTPRDRAG